MQHKRRPFGRLLRCLFFPAAPYLGQKRRRRHRFYHIAVDDAVAAGVHNLPCRGIGHHYAGHARVAAPDGHAEIHAAAAHQALVDGEDVEGLLLQQLAQLAPAGTGGHTQAQSAEVFVQQVEDLVVVVRRKDAQLAVHAPLQLFALLLQTLHADGAQIDAIYERNDVKLRQKEGMEQGTGFVTLDGLRTDLDGHVTIRENGILYDVDYIHGQKTGFFLDQKYNRRAAAQLAQGKHVLDCFTHTGAFGLNCAAAGAASVLSVDVSEDALTTARHNAALNGLQDRVEYLCADVFDLLTKLAEQKRGAYDYIILDPPAFTKSSATVANAIRGYKEINLKAMRILPRGGYLATCSCSHFMTDDRFRAMLADAARDAQVSLRQIEARQQGPDHPILWNVPETDYLKFYLFQVV